MTLTNYDWKQDKEDEKGYYFVLTDTLHHLDYNVVLIKDNGDIMVNGDYINNVPQCVAAAIAPRLDYFMAMKKIRNQHHHDEAKKAEPKKDDKKPEPKKAEKKDEKKSEPKKDEKKSESKKTEKKDEKKDKK